MRSLEDGVWAGKKVLVRIDADVPLNSQLSEITDDYRLRKLLPTLFYLLNHRAQIILCGHLGRPGGTTDRKLSLKPVFLHLSALLNQKILFTADPFSPAARDAIDKLDDKQIIGLENIRFWKGEEDNSRTFARKLANLADIYVNEAFGSSHPGASIIAITEFLPHFAGLQFEREVETLTELTKHPARPLVTIVGGAKAADKITAISQLLPLVDRIFVGGRTAVNFLASQGIDVKNSKTEPELINQAGQVYKRAKGKIILPTDHIWSDDQILDVGPNSIEKILAAVKTAQTVIWSGVLGKVETDKFSLASKRLAEVLSNSPATTIIGGGDTVGFVDGLGLINKYSFVSTGGSAMLELLGGRTLPAIQALNH